MKLYNYKRLNAKQVEKKCRQIFIENYIRDVNNNKILIYTTLKERVIFNENDFSHAFSYRNKRNGVEEFSFQRARRVLWIKEIVTGKCPSVRKEIGKEVYFYYNSRQEYIVFLKKLSWGGLLFITHYVAKSKKKQDWIRKNILS